VRGPSDGGGCYLSGQRDAHGGVKIMDIVAGSEMDRDGLSTVVPPNERGRR
jgi:hypothetical protein